MYDLLPFPNITATDATELMAQVNNYLIQFKETLEFVLTNISTDNLSPDLISKLNELGAEIEKSNEERDDQINQVSNKTITISDVLNSPAFKVTLDGSVDNAVNDIVFTVNFNTGNLEYTTSKE